jgi:hypothetical protein
VGGGCPDDEWRRGGEGTALTVGDMRAVSGAGGAVGPWHSQSDMWQPVSLVACDPSHVRRPKRARVYRFQSLSFKFYAWTNCRGDRPVAVG